MLRLALATLTCSALALPAAAQSVIETDQMTVYEGQWVQTKLPEQKGALLYLTQPRGQVGEYFSITCAGASARTIKLGFLTPLPGDTVNMSVDGTNLSVPVVSTGTTRDTAYTQSDIHRYDVAFADAGQQSAFLDALKRGSELRITGQTLPVSLKGATAALNGQGAHCK